MCVRGRREGWERCVCEGEKGRVGEMYHYYNMYMLVSGIQPKYIKS